MANPEHVEILKQGVVVWNKWRDENPDDRPDFSNAVLTEADLSKANLSKANLSKANLFKANLSKANLSKANLSKANLFKANLFKADLFEADLSKAFLLEADLSEAILFGANLSNARLNAANLSRADLTEAILFGADLTVANLSKAKLSVVKYNRSEMRRKFLGVQIDTAFGDALFKRDAQDQDYIDSLENSWQEFWWKRKLFKAWGWIDYGRSLIRVAVPALLLALGFGLVYLLFPAMLIICNDLNPWIAPFYYSIVTYTTLGFGDVTPANTPGMILVTIEVILGYITLGLLISILANKVARRA